ncbi:anthranilate O-methyltransferase 3-like [Panicum miliaceum]|uniref:Anthranilate O-methyltransferase 3-like n=1 Tax=Panicum miliaceum TaxID=4540 RepID=A0A3L6PGK3_PANMI|nr:anthranilate O-methyltransferase 3-like [Panicum miliaceum]
MNMETDFHMAKEESESSYSNNSRLQRKALLETKQVLENAVKEKYSAVLPSKLVVVDLGCSSGENTLIFISEVIGHLRLRGDQGHERPPATGGPILPQ